MSAGPATWPSQQVGLLPERPGKLPWSLGSGSEGKEAHEKGLVF